MNITSGEDTAVSLGGQKTIVKRDFSLSRQIRRIRRRVVFWIKVRWSVYVIGLSRDYHDPVISCDKQGRPVKGTENRAFRLLQARASKERVFPRDHGAKMYQPSLWKRYPQESMVMVEGMETLVVVSYLPRNSLFFGQVTLFYRLHEARIREEAIERGRQLEAIIREEAIKAAVEQVRQEAELEKAAALRESEIDEVTKLPVRRAAISYLDKTFKKLALHPGHAVGIILLDVHKFKDLQDKSLGKHDTGDKILRRVADVLKHVCRGSDYVARWGGDEDALIAYFEDMTTRRAKQIINDLLKRINNQLGVPVKLGDDVVEKIQVCAGATVVTDHPPTDSAEVDDLMKEVSKAVFENKSKRDKVVTFCTWRPKPRHPET